MRPRPFVPLRPCRRERREPHSEVGRHINNVDLTAECHAGHCKHRSPTPLVAWVLYLKDFHRGIIVAKAHVLNNFAYAALAVAALVFVGMLVLTQLHP